MSHPFQKSISLRRTLLQRVIAATLLPQALALATIAVVHGEIDSDGVIGLILVALSAGLAFSIFLALRTHCQVVQTIENLQVRLASISLGDFKTEPDFLCGPDFEEYSELLTGIDRMADALAVRERDLKAVRREFEVLFNNSGDAVFIIEASESEELVGRLIQVNERACELTNLPRSALLGRSFLEIFSVNTAEDPISPVKELSDYGHHLFEALVTGNEIPVEINARVFHQRGQRQVIASARDISTRKRNERALVRAKEVAEQANLAKSEFISVMSHEIRTPLGAVIGFTEILEMEIKRDDHRAYLRSILENAHTLIRLIDDILDYGRLSIEKLTITPAPTDLKKFHADLCSYAKLKISQSRKPITFSSFYEPTLPASIVTDRDRLHQVLTNLINNAIKYSESGNLHLAFRGEETGKHKKTLAISVEDEGAGISADNQERMWKAFEQLGAGAGTKVEGGVGLGLAICKRLVEHLGGSIHCESEEGKGSRFWVNLDLASTQSFDKKKPVLDANSPIVGPLPKMICAEDNAANRAILRVLLTKLNQECSFVENGQALLDSLATGSYDMILLDLNMPLMDGFEACRMIRRGDAGEHNRDIFISALTAAASDECRQKCLEAGMNCFMTKPFTTGILKNIIHQYQASLQRSSPRQDSSGRNKEDPKDCPET